MRLLPAMCLVASMCLAADEPSPEPGGADDLKNIQGTWSVVKWTQSGKPVPPAMLDAKLVFEKGHFSITGKALPPARKHPFVLRPKMMPGEFNIGGPMDERAMKGIYRLTKDELTIVYHGLGRDRPKTFDEAGASVWVLKRDRK